MLPTTNGWCYGANAIIRATSFRTAVTRLSMESNDNNEDEEVFSVSRKFMVARDNSDISSSMKSNYMDDLTRPPINFARDSILFSENPSTLRNNSGLQAWQFFKRYLPTIFTGAWPWRDSQVSDSNPIGAIYNMLFVRTPVVLLGIVYFKNKIEGHPLVMDFGSGQSEINPLLVFVVLALILA